MGQLVPKPAEEKQAEPVQLPPNLPLSGELPPSSLLIRRDIPLIISLRAQIAPEAAVIWPPRQRGVDNNDFAPFPDEILDFGGPVCRFILPNAPRA